MLLKWFRKRRGSSSFPVQREASQVIDDSVLRDFHRLLGRPELVKAVQGDGSQYKGKSIQLAFQSIHFEGGHGGWETVYYVEEHKVVHKSWSTKTPLQLEELDIPASIQDINSVREYVDEVMHRWLKG